jgi:WXXGXW repeat (2 copies)
MNRKRLVNGVLLAVLIVASSAVSFGQIGVLFSVSVAPPALPVYTQPLCPGPGYLWTPGYWAWDEDDGYYWVPGTWVLAPVGMLWTPGWWEWNEGFYVFHLGYWGPHVGFYGGIDYGFGYTGEGFYGGEWRGNEFYYNRSVTNVNVTNITNVYNKTVIVNNTTFNRVSYNGGNGGVEARPTWQERAAEHERRQFALPAQIHHQQTAEKNRELFARVNQGRPPVAATVRPADFHSAVPAKAAGARYRAPSISPRAARGPATPVNRRFPVTNSNSADRNRSMNSVNPRRDSNSASLRNDGFRQVTPAAGRRSPNQQTNYSRPQTWPRPNDSRLSNNRSFNAPPNASHSSNVRPQNELRTQSSARRFEAQRPTRGFNSGPLASYSTNSRPQNFARLQNDARSQSFPHPAQRRYPTRDFSSSRSVAHPLNSRPQNFARPQSDVRSQTFSHPAPTRYPTRDFSSARSVSHPPNSLPQKDLGPQNSRRPPQAQRELTSRPTLLRPESTPRVAQRHEAAPLRHNNPHK